MVFGHGGRIFDDLLWMEQRAYRRNGDIADNMG